jgi:trans-aconitate 2-methyltransferase
MERRTTDWDAAGYDRLAAPQEQWGREVLERLPLVGDETVVDAGCGSGRVTRLLLDRLPRGKVIGVDGSPSMIEEARAALAGYGGRVDLVLSDLTEFVVAEPVDAVFSNATFHWIHDHDALFGRLPEVLRPGGRMVAQCGGAGNVAELEQAILAVAEMPEFASTFAGWKTPWHFAEPEETENRLRAAGFECVRPWLEERLVTPDDPRAYIESSALAAHFERLDPELRKPFTDAVMAELPNPLILRYLRLNIDARRPE